LVTADGDPAAERELGVHPDAAVGLPRRDVDLGDEVGEPGVAELPLRRRTAAPGVEARLGDLKHPARGLDREALCGYLLDGREPLFWGFASFRSSAARRAILSSVSSCTIRRRALVVAPELEVEAACDRFHIEGSVDPFLGCAIVSSPCEGGEHLGVVPRGAGHVHLELGDPDRAQDAADPRRPHDDEPLPPLALSPDPEHAEGLVVEVLQEAPAERPQRPGPRRELRDEDGRAPRAARGALQNPVRGERPRAKLLGVDAARRTPKPEFLKELDGSVQAGHGPQPRGGQHDARSIIHAPDAACHRTLWHREGGRWTWLDDV
jgi:hypothetical protein